MGVFGVGATIFVFVLGREFFRLDKWKEDFGKYVNSELSRAESFIESNKHEMSLMTESVKVSFLKEVDRLRTETAEYRKFCVFRIDGDIKRINGDSKKDAKEIGELKGEHKKLEYMVDTIRQFYEENRSLLEDKVDILKRINDVDNRIKDKLREIEAKISDIDIIKNQISLMDYDKEGS